ncbi:hypothetical protein DSO57_1002676 [Entomophthora muscae]|uniref:Uncharacterized protein n=1 Tax=Entomophthora muscae TaxID=34485 RepID=A0ACC2UIA1_9FUNG|nr:hypothetical protein DSO57_1002676 [Entomophthora muscae]
MPFSSDFPGTEDDPLPTPRNQRLPSFLETNVWGQEDESASSFSIETKVKVDPISKPIKVLPSISKEEFNQQSSFTVKSTSPTYWDDPTSAWGSEPAFKPPSSSLEKTPDDSSLAQDITPDVPSEDVNINTVPLEEFPDTFGEFSSFNNSFGDFNPDEPQEADFGGFEDFTTDTSSASKPFESKPELEIDSIPRETWDIIHCFNVDVDQEIHTILENLCGLPSEPLELDYSLDSIPPSVSKEVPMSPEVQALKRGLFSPTQVNSKFSWQGSNTEAIFFCINDVSEKAQVSHYKGFYNLSLREGIN